MPRPPQHPFSTDLASVPRSLTWLFPRYGKYTKAAVVHDYLCQNFRSAPSVASPASLLPLVDRSDADEVFFLLMTELGVPVLRRGLMWGAVSWATLITALMPGRRGAARHTLDRSDPGDPRDPGRVVRASSRNTISPLSSKRP